MMPNLFLTPFFSLKKFKKALLKAGLCIIYTY